MHLWADLPGFLPLDKLPAHTHADLVPYTGATGPINLGIHGLTAGSLDASGLVTAGTIQASGLNFVTSETKIDRPQLGTLRLSNTAGPVMTLAYAGNDRSGSLFLNGGRVGAQGVNLRPGFDVFDQFLDGAQCDFGSYNSNGVMFYFGLWKKAGSPGVMQVKHGPALWTSIEAGNATFTGAGPTLFLNRSGMSSSFSLGDANGDTFRIQNANALTDLLRIHQTTRDTNLYGKLDVAGGIGLFGTPAPLIKPTLPTNPTNSEIAALLSTYGFCTLV
jgi:hypothetical protein